jgi:hypothetical protein
MANTVTTTFPINESYLFQALIKVVGDGSGEVTSGVIIDPANLTGAPSKFDIETIDFELNGFTANLFWDATTPVLACALPSYDGYINFKQSGQARHNDAGAGITGKLTITTKGLIAAAAGTIIIKGYHR